MKVLVITNMIAPYRIPLLNRLNEESGIELKVIFTKERGFNRSWNIDYDQTRFNFQILTGFYVPFKNQGSEIHINRKMFLTLVKENPDVMVVGGYGSLMDWVALLYRKLFSKKIILWSGSTLLSRENNEGIIGRLKRIFVTNCDAYLAYGSKAREYLEFLGATRNKIFVGCNVGDVSFFRERVGNYRKSEEYFKERKKYPNILLLYVGRLIPGKGIINLLHALNSISSKKKTWGLLIAGDGPQRRRLETFCPQHGLKNVYFLGFKQKNELVRYYSLSDIFIFPTLSDCFGIVVSEALASGLFVLGSKCDGATYDLIKEGVNGLVVDPYNICDLKAKIEYVMTNFNSLPTKEEITEAITSFTIESYAEKFIEAIDFVTQKYGLKETIRIANYIKKS